MTIDAARRCRSRFKELTKQIQTLTGGVGVPEGVPGGSGAGAAPGGSQGAQEPQGSGALAPAPGGADAEAFQRYADCLKDADPADPAEVAACGELLTAP